MTTRKLDRRQFLVSGAGAAAALALPGCGSAPLRIQARGPDDEIRVAVAGIRSRGRDHIAGFARLPNVRVVALCDVDQQILDREAARCRERGMEVATYRDLRQVLDRADVDLVSLATPNHWHALGAVWACQAGKDVYLEKPVSHTVWEGRQIVNAARRHGRIVQAGTQSRSSQAIAEAIAWLHEGNLGRIRWAQGLCYKPRQSIGKVSAPVPVPEHIDYDLWCGPAPMEPLWRKELHYDWHWVHATGNGDLGNQGIHQMDLCRWALGEQGLPRGVRSVGARLGYDDDGNTPNTQFTVFDYPTAPLVFEVRGLPRDTATQQSSWNSKGMDQVQGTSIAALIHCEGGTLRIPDYQSAVAVDRDGAEIRRWSGARDHYANFLDAVRSRRQDDLNADIEQGHVSSAICHLGMISHHLGTAALPAAIGKAVESDERATDALERMREHLLRNRVDLDRTPLVLGAALRFHPYAERFVGAPDADALLRAEYRKPFVVPDLS